MSDFDPFDAKFNTVPPKPVVPPADTGDKTKTPAVDTGDKTKTPAPKTNFSPDSVFDDAYNLVPKTVKPTDKTTVVPKPETPFDPKFNQLNKVSDFPIPKEAPRPFTQNGEVGKLFVDEKSGFVNGMQFTEGSRKGQKYAFDRDPQGNITKMHILMPGKDAATPPQYLSFQKTDKGWVSKPEGQLPPNFKNLKVENGVITGDFKVNSKGDFGYESADKQIRSIVRINGDKDNYDMREYAREREVKNGDKTDKSTTYWNGYDWLPGQRKQLAEGVVRVDFQPQPGKPTSMIRDGKNNGFKVEFSTEKTQYTVPNWKDGVMTREIAGTKPESLYNTGVQDAQGKLQWRKGEAKPEGDKRVVTFNDAQDAAKIRAGELPQSSVINPKTGEVVSVFANGTQVTADNGGATQKIIYNNKQQVDVLRDPNNDFRGYRRSDGTTIYRGADLNLGAGGPASTWTVQRPGEQPITINGMLKQGNAGSFSILNAGNEGLSVTPEGVMSTKLGGKVTSDAPRPGDKPPAPAPKDVQPPAKPTDKPPEAPKPTDKAPGKAPLTDEQFQALVKKYNLKPNVAAVINSAKLRAERQGLHQTFTQEGLDKLLELADKHKLLGDFASTADLSQRSRPGAVIGRLIPELLLDPSTAIEKANTQARETMAKSLKDSGIPQQRINSVLQTIDQKYTTIKASTQPFITQLTKELPKGPTPPAPTPIPLPK